MMSPHVTGKCHGQNSPEYQLSLNVTATTPGSSARARARTRNLLQLAQFVYIRDTRIRSDI